MRRAAALHKHPRRKPDAAQPDDSGAARFCEAGCRARRKPERSNVTVFTAGSTSATSSEVEFDLDIVRAAFDASSDFTLGLEEEFAVLEPVVIGSTARFEEPPDAANLHI